MHNFKQKSRGFFFFLIFIIIIIIFLKLKRNQTTLWRWKNLIILLIKNSVLNLDTKVVERKKSVICVTQNHFHHII